MRRRSRIGGFFCSTFFRWRNLEGDGWGGASRVRDGVGRWARERGVNDEMSVTLRGPAMRVCASSLIDNFI